MHKVCANRNKSMHTVRASRNGTALDLAQPRTFVKDLAYYGYRTMGGEDPHERLDPNLLATCFGSSSERLYATSIPPQFVSIRLNSPQFVQGMYHLSSDLFQYVSINLNLYTFIT